METATVESCAKGEQQFPRVTNTDKIIEERICAFYIGINCDSQ